MGTALKKQKSHNIVVFTLQRGPVPGWAESLICQGWFACTVWCSGISVSLCVLVGCNTHYYPNYSSLGGIRTYGHGVPDVVQVGEHQYVERLQLKSWSSLMVLGGGYGPHAAI